MTAEESQSLQLNPQVTAENEEMSAAAQFGELFKKRGDEVNALIQRSREEGRDFADNVAEEEDPNEAIQSFLEVAAHAFEIGPDGLGMIGKQISPPSHFNEPIFLYATATHRL